MDVLLVEAGSGQCGQGVSATHRLAAVHPPLGLTYIGTYLRRNGYSVRGVDLHGVDTFADLEDALAAKPLVVGIGFVTEAYHYAKAAIDLVRDRQPRAIVVLGGPHASFRTEATLSELAPDAIVPWEGELVMVDLVRAAFSGRPIAHVPGVKTAENTLLPGRRIADLDDLLPPDRTVFNLTKYTFAKSPGASGIFLLHAVRGCPMSCKFCVAAAKRRFQQLRMRSNKSLLSEIEQMQKEYGAKGFVISDELFVINEQQVREFCRGLRALPKLEWSCEVRVDRITRDTLVEMAAAGCTYVQIGIESGDDATLKSIGKMIRVEQILRVARWCRDLGIGVVGGMIFGLHVDTHQTIVDKFKLAAELTDLGVHLGCSFATPYPGTAYFEERESLGIHIESPDWGGFRFENCVISTNNLSQSALTEYAQGFSRFLRQRRELHAVSAAIQSMRTLG